MRLKKIGKTRLRRKIERIEKTRLKRKIIKLFHCCYCITMKQWSNKQYNHQFTLLYRIHIIGYPKSSDYLTGLMSCMSFLSLKQLNDYVWLLNDSEFFLNNKLQKYKQMKHPRLFKDTQGNDYNFKKMDRWIPPCVLACV